MSMPRPACAVLLVLATTAVAARAQGRSDAGAATSASATAEAQAAEAAWLRAIGDLWGWRVDPVRGLLPPTPPHHDDAPAALRAAGPADPSGVTGLDALAAPLHGPRPAVAHHLDRRRGLLWSAGRLAVLDDLGWLLRAQEPRRTVELEVLLFRAPTDLLWRLGIDEDAALPGADMARLLQIAARLPGVRFLGSARPQLAPFAAGRMARWLPGARCHAVADLHAAPLDARHARLALALRELCAHPEPGRLELHQQGALRTTLALGETAVVQTSPDREGRVTIAVVRLAGLRPIAEPAPRGR